MKVWPPSILRGDLLCRGSWELMDTFFLLSSLGLTVLTWALCGFSEDGSIGLYFKAAPELASPLSLLSARFPGLSLQNKVTAQKLFASGFSVSERGLQKWAHRSKSRKYTLRVDCGADLLMALNPSLPL